MSLKDPDAATQEPPAVQDGPGEVLIYEITRDDGGIMLATENFREMVERLEACFDFGGSAGGVRVSSRWGKLSELDK